MPFKSLLTTVFARQTEWAPPLLVLVLLGALWWTMFERARHDDALIIQEAFINNGNVAQAVALHIEQALDRLRFYNRTLTGNARRDHAVQELVRMAVGQDATFLRLMHFSATGELLFTTGTKPEAWLMDAVRQTAKRPAAGEVFIIATVPPEAYAQAWSLPIIHRLSREEGFSGDFVIALLDLGSIARRFENFQLGKSGEILIIAEDGRELLRLRNGSLDPVESIAGSERHRRAFSATNGAVIEQTRDNHERLYAFHRIAGSPLAVLVDRTRYDVLFENAATQRSYWGSALLLTVLALVPTGLWLVVARRRRLLTERLTRAQTENARLIEQLEQEKLTAYRMATHDRLTGLANRMLFNEIAARYVAQAKRQRSRFAVMFVDLDRFKPINDTWGHKAGDQLLIEVARRLTGAVRQTDLVARFGGDEFVALVSNLRGPRDADTVAGKVVAKLSEPYTGIVGETLSVTPSIGIAFYPDDATEVDALLRAADTAMYQAKNLGRATWVFADATLNRRHDLYTAIEAQLPAALRQGQIAVHYQPIIDLKEFTLSGFEALARWQHQELGAISPTDFVAVAENSGQINELGEYVIEAVAAQLEQWWRAGLPLLPVAVNVSVRQLRTSNLFEIIQRTLERHAVPPRYFSVEITETGLIDPGDKVIETLRRLDGLGVHLAIDDFGTGFSGLTHLRTLPIKRLKIDRSFITDIRNDINDATIVSSTIALSHNLHLQVVAEGVETREQLAHLRANGCDYAQGYFFSPAVEASQATQLLERPDIYHPLFASAETAP